MSATTTNVPMMPEGVTSNSLKAIASFSFFSVPLSGLSFTAFEHSWTTRSYQSFGRLREFW